MAEFITKAEPFCFHYCIFFSGNFSDPAETWDVEYRRAWAKGQFALVSAVGRSR